MKLAPRQVWKPQWGYRRFDRWTDLRKGQANVRAIFFGPGFARTGLRRIAEHYGLEFVAIDGPQPKAFRLAVPVALSEDRMRRLANYVDRTPKLHPLNRVSSAMRRQLCMLDRLRHKAI